MRLSARTANILAVIIINAILLSFNITLPIISVVALGVIYLMYRISPSAKRRKLYVICLIVSKALHIYGLIIAARML